MLEYRTALITAAVTGKIDVRGKGDSRIPEQEGLELMDNARQAVEAFSTFMEEFSEKAGFDIAHRRVATPGIRRREEMDVIPLKSY